MLPKAAFRSFTKMIKNFTKTCFTVACAIITVIGGTLLLYAIELIFSEVAEFAIHCLSLLSPPPEDLDPIQPRDFSNCTRLQEIIGKIRTHILSSNSTLDAYHVACKEINKHLKHETQVDLSVDELERHFESNWPAFVPLKGNPTADNEIYWGKVERFRNAPNEISLNPDLVTAVEDAMGVRNFSSASFVYRHDAN
jgi:hypothetical protein